MEKASTGHLIICGIGSSFSTISIILVLVSFCKMNYKTISELLRIYCTLFDTLFTIIYTTYMFLVPNTDMEKCILYSSLFFIIFSHGLWIFYMSYSMYQIIYLQREKTKISVHTSCMIIIVFVLFISVTNFIRVGSSECLVMKTYIQILYIALGIIFPNILILTFLLHFYKKIRNTLKTEIEEKKKFSKTRLKFADRMRAYPLLFLVFDIPIVLFVFEIEFESAYFILAPLVIFFYSFYPFFNSVLYGLTPSSQQALKSIFKNNLIYKEREQILFRLRQYGILAPRYYFDILGLPERDLLKGLKDYSK